MFEQPPRPTQYPIYQPHSDGDDDDDDDDGGYMFFFLDKGTGWLTANYESILYRVDFNEIRLPRPGSTRNIPDDVNCDMLVFFR